MALPGALRLVLLVLTIAKVTKGALGQVQTLTPPTLDTIEVDMYRATEGGTMLMETAGSLGTEDNGTTWSFLLRPHVYSYELDYLSVITSVYINNAACVYFAFQSNYSTVHAFLTTQAGADNIMDVQQGIFNLSRIVPLAGANLTNVRSGRFLSATNTSGVYALSLLNDGGQVKDHYNLNESASTSIATNLGAYDPSSPVCQNATAAQSGTLITSVSTNQTLNILREYHMLSKTAHMVAAFTNVSCLAYQLLSEVNYTQINETAFVQASSLARDITVAVTSSTAAITWASRDFPPTMPIIGQYCYQRTLNGIAPSNATSIFGSGTQASNVTSVVGNVMINATQTCQMVIDNLDPEQIYIIWAVNGLNTVASMSQNATASVRYAARPIGSCAFLEFPPPSYVGAPVPPEDVVPLVPPGPPPPPLTAAQQFIDDEIEDEQIQLLLQEDLAPKGAPAPAPDGMPIGDVLLAPGVPNLTSFVETYDTLAPSLSGESLSAPSPTTPAGLAPEPSASPLPSGAVNGPTGSVRYASYSKLSTGAIVGIAIGAVVAVGIAVAIIAAVFVRKCKPDRGILLNPKECPSEAETNGTSLSLSDQASGETGSGWTDSNKAIHVAACHSQKQLSEVSSTSPQASPFGADTVRSLPPPMVFEPPKFAAAPHASSQLIAFDSANGSQQSLGSGSLQSQASADDFWLKSEDLEYLHDENGNPVELGRGGHGVVKECKLKGILVAVKELIVSNDSLELANLEKEKQLLKDCRHTNIVTLFGAIYEDGTLKLVMERLEGKFDSLRYHYGELYSWRMRGWQVAMDIALALAYLHARNVIHFDVKSGNVLLSFDGKAKLCDVGISATLSTHQMHPSEIPGFSTAWAAPEVLRGQPDCTFKADIWSYGIFLHEVITAEMPIRGNMAEIRVPEHCPQEVKKLYQWCIKEDPDQRPTAGEVVERLEALHN